MSEASTTPKPAPPRGACPLTARAIADAAERLASPSTVVSGVLELLDDPSTPMRLIAARVG